VIAQLYHGDCLDIMPTFPARSVDLILSDLPYGTTQNKWDSVIPLDRLWAEYWRIAKPNAAIVLTAAQPFTSALVMSCSQHFRYDWVWEKNNPSGHLNANKRPLRAHEDVLVFCAGTPSYFPQKTQGHPLKQATRLGFSSNYGTQKTNSYASTERYPRSVQKINGHPKLESVHPTQKPVALMEYLIRTYTNPGGVVLDNCMGSGTTGVAAMQSGRRFIGIEREEGYFAICKERIQPPTLDELCA
jgi:DNA modification methylase